MLSMLMDQLLSVINTLSVIPVYYHALWQGRLSRQEGLRSTKSVCFQHVYKHSNTFMMAVLQEKRLIACCLRHIQLLVFDLCVDFICVYYFVLGKNAYVYTICALSLQNIEITYLACVGVKLHNATVFH